MHDRWKLLLAAAQSADYSVKFGKIRGVERNAQFRFGPDRSCGADPRCPARQIYASDVDAVSASVVRRVNGAGQRQLGRRG